MRAAFTLIISLFHLLVPNSCQLDLLILHDNDQHARFEETDRFSGPCRPGQTCFGGFARIAHVVREARKNESESGPAVLYLNAGDTYQGTPYYTLYKWNVTYRLMNALKPDAMSLGNHEFDDGVQGLIPFLLKVKFPVIACNLNLKKEVDLKRTNRIKRSVVFYKKGIKVGVIGYLTPETKFLAPANNIEFLDEVQELNREAKRLKSSGVDIIIALGHSGFDKDCAIAREVPDVDLVIGGHSNTFLWNGKRSKYSERPDGPYPKIITQSLTNKSVPVVQSYAYTKYLGQLLLKFDQNGALIYFEGQPIMLTEAIKQDKDVLDLIERFKPGVLKSRTRIIGICDKRLDGDRCRSQECVLGNLLSDSMVLIFKERFGNNVDAIGLLNGGAVRSSINTNAQGYVSMEALMTVLPFGNDLILGRYAGSTIKQALEHGVRRHSFTTTNGEFLQISGLQITYNLTAEPGNRVESVKVLCQNCTTGTYQDLVDDQVYNVVLNFFLSKGGDGYYMLRDDAISQRNLGIDDLKAAELYFRRMSPIWQGLDGRISFLKQVSPREVSFGIKQFIPFKNVVTLFICIDFVIFYYLY